MWQTIFPSSVFKPHSGPVERKMCRMSNYEQPNAKPYEFFSGATYWHFRRICLLCICLGFIYFSMLKCAISPFFNHFHVSGICSSSFRLFLRYSGPINANCLPICTAMFISCSRSYSSTWTDEGASGWFQNHQECLFPIGTGMMVLRITIIITGSGSG